MFPQAPPDRLVNAAGTVTFGMFNAPLKEVDLDQALVPCTLPGMPASWRLKQWQHFAVVTPHLALTFAVVDAVFTKVAWVQLVDRRTGRVVEHARRSPGTKVQLARSLWEDRTTARAKRLKIDVHNHLAAGVHNLVVEAGVGSDRVVAHLTCMHNLETVHPMVVSLPVGRGRSMYSHKVPLPVTGHITLGGEQHEVLAADSTAILDIHKAHYPRHTWWKWSTAAGFDARGRRVAFNLTRNVVIDDALHENALWIDGALFPLPHATFQLDGEPWRMRSDDGAVDLTFHTDGDRREDLNYGLVQSAFVQRFGRYTGTIRHGDETIDVSDWWGLAENHRAVW